MDMPDVQVRAVTKRYVNQALDQVCAAIYEVAEMVEEGGGGSGVDWDTFNAVVSQVQNLQSTINTLTGLVNQAVDNVANLTSSVNAMGEAIDMVSTRVSALENA